GIGAIPHRTANRGTEIGAKATPLFSPALPYRTETGPLEQPLAQAQERAARPAHTDAGRVRLDGVERNAVRDLPLIIWKVHARCDGRREGAPVAAVDFHQPIGAVGRPPKLDLSGALPAERA